MKKKTSINATEYDKQVRRIKALKTRLIKQGYEIPFDLLPKRPQRITKKSIERLKDITPEYVRELSESLKPKKPTQQPLKTRRPRKKEEDFASPRISSDTDIRTGRVGRPEKIKEIEESEQQYVDYYSFVYRNFIERTNIIAEIYQSQLPKVVLSFLQDLEKDLGKSDTQKIFTDAINELIREDESILASIFQMGTFNYEEWKDGTNVNKLFNRILEKIDDDTGYLGYERVFNNEIEADELFLDMDYYDQYDNFVKDGELE